MSTQRSARSYRRPGIERRAQLLAAARQLLEHQELDQISLGDVARTAGIPKGSAYFFYGDIMDLYVHLLADEERDLIADLTRPINHPVESWRIIVEELIRRGVRFYAAHAAARQLMVGPRTPPKLKLRDRQNDISLGRLFETHIEAQFELPRIAQRAAIFFRAVEIADLMFCLSMWEHGRITSKMGTEAARATVGYLSAYLPESLPRVKPSLRSSP